MLRSGLTNDGADLAAVAAGGFALAAAAAAANHVPSGSPGSLGFGSARGPHPQQGAYLALPDGSFAGSAPMRGVPTTEGLLFEKYSRRTQAVDLPELQVRQGGKE
jgi:hypothetical protein